MTNTRTRKGCLTCRSRKRKCDSTHPRCESCETRDLTCRWGLKASFHPSRQIELTDRERQHLTHVEGRRQQRPSAKFIDSTRHIYRYFRDSNVTNADLLSSLEVLDVDHDATESATVPDTLSVSAFEDPEPLHENTSSFSNETAPLSLACPMGHDDEGHAVVDALDSRRRSPTFEAEHVAQLSDSDGTHGHPEAHAVPPMEEADALGVFPTISFSGPTLDDDLGFTDGGYHDLPFSLGLALSQDAERVTAAGPWTEPEFPLNADETLELIQSFITCTATWCETTDTSRSISVGSAHDIVAHKICMAAALALTCRQRSVFHNCYQETALQLYQYTIQLLIRQDPDYADPFVLTACILLCVYEMISADVADWRRHLKGCASLFVMRGWNGSSTGLIKSCFWAFARIDIWASFVSGKQTLIPTHQWVDNDSLESAASITTPDDYCNLCIVAFARTINYIVRLRQASATDQAAVDEARQLCDYLRQWWDLRPQQVRPLLRCPKSTQNIFPKTIFTSPAPICGNTFYHCSVILLLKVLPSRHRLESSFHHPHGDPIFHALEIGGISVSNPDHANWVNHLQPLYIAGQAFAENPNFPPGLSHAASDQRALQGNNQPGGGRATVPGTEISKYAAEKFALLRQLQVIQAETGWKTDERARELRHLWGLQ